MQVNVMVSCGRGGCAVTWPCPVVPDGDPGARAEPEQRRLLLRLRPRRLCCRLCRRPVPPPPPTLPPSFYLYLWLLLLLYYYCNHTVKQLKCLVESCGSGEPMHLFAIPCSWTKICYPLFHKNRKLFFFYKFPGNYFVHVNRNALRLNLHLTPAM